MNKKLVVLSLSLGIFGVGSTAFLGNQYSQAKAELQTGTTIEENKNVSKEDIHYKMLNSIDFFDKAKGNFVYGSVTADFHIDVEYQVKLKDGAASYYKAKDKNGIVTQSAADGAVLTQLDDKDKTYVSFNIPKVKENPNKKSVESRYGKTQDGKNEYSLRYDPSHMGVASNSLFSQNMALGFLEDYTKWSIKGEEKYLSLDSVVIEGTLNDYYKEKHQASTFKFWVHKDTGILLKMEEYNEKGEVVEYLITESIKLNETIDEGKFKMKAPKEYKNKLADI
ncbi:hypothetical protein CU633_19235 [Bacillus sp. V3-13]|uniref:hypothetical protein n=1 Tax=Bacillus sp. V3-13 TaxID=2053728 RepID=UPI000C762C40|nr:hypothetical protein [Bacillus sp. V3-13]PLR75772.1 hypothetical protein CU633_19235 [Bacillus sp. V3-13]